MLREIICCLSESELRILRKMYQKSEQVKSLILLKLIKREGIKTDSEASDLLYGLKPGPKYFQVKKNLKNHALDVLLCGESANKYNSDNARAVFDCRKLILQGHILMGKGYGKAAVKLLEEARALTTEFELPLERLIIDDLLHDYMGFFKGLEAMQKFDESLQENWRHYEYIRKAKNLRSNLMFPNEFSTNKNETYAKYSENIINKLGSLYKESKSPMVGYLYYHSTALYYEFIKDYRKSFLYSKKLLVYLDKQNAINSSARKGACYLQMAVACIGLGDFQSALIYSQKANPLFEGHRFNYLKALQVRFLIYFYKGEYVKCEKVLGEVFLDKQLERFEFLNSKWNYFKALYLYGIGEYIESKKLVRQIKGLFKDRTGWQLGVRILYAMLCIELNHFEEMDLIITNFKKHLQRVKQAPLIMEGLEEGGINYKRVNLIFSTLYKIAKYNYNNGNFRFQFDLVAELNNEAIEKLKEGKGKYAWDPISFEVIRFDKWFMKKCASVETLKSTEVI